MDWKEIVKTPTILNSKKQLKKRLSISFSGGKTSAVMTKWLLENIDQSQVDIEVTFANTGCEHEATLEFVKQCDEHFNFNTVWLEAVVTHDARVGIRHKQVNFETASRSGEPFEQYIQKYGIPNRSNPQCTSRLKTEVFDSYLQREVGWNRNTYCVAVGIRVDEIDRAVKRRQPVVIYPLINLQKTRQDVINEVATWPFTLNLPGDHYGNCVWCWKKSKRKLLTLAKQDPQVFSFPQKMEDEYSSYKCSGERRYFFRGPSNTRMLLKEAQTTHFHIYNDTQQPFDPDLDVGSGCGESCEVYADETEPRG